MSRSAVFLVQLSRPSAQTVTVNYATVAGTATASSDFTPVSGTISFAPGQTSSQVVVPIVEPLDGEPKEQFTLVLSNPVNATLANSSGTGTIPQKNPTQFPVVSVADVSGRTLTFTVSLSQAHTIPCSISYSTKSISAIASKDYTPASGTLAFAIGETSKSISVPVLAKSDRDLKLKLVLASPVKITLFRLKTGVGTITPDADVVAKVTAAKTAKTAYETAVKEAADAKAALDKAWSEWDNAAKAYDTAAGDQVTATAEVAAATNNVRACQQQLTNCLLLAGSNSTFATLAVIAQTQLDAANAGLTAAQSRLTAANAELATKLSAKNTAYSAYQSADSTNTTKQNLVTSTKATFDTAYATAKAAFVGSTTIDF